MDIDAIVEFIIKYIPYDDNGKELKEYIKKHIEYGTLDYAIDDKGKIIAVVRWNVVDDIWDILDFAIDADWRNNKIGSDLILRGLKRFPNGKYLRFRRSNRNKRDRLITIEKVLKTRGRGL